MMKFEACNKCGLCCCLCDKHSDLKVFDRGDGICKNLKQDNTCSIYDTRPDICNIAKTFEARKYPTLTLEKYYEISEEACKAIKKYFGKDKVF